MADFMWAALIILSVAAVTAAVIFVFGWRERREHKKMMEDIKKQFDDEYWQ